MAEMQNSHYSCLQNGNAENCLISNGGSQHLINSIQNGVVERKFIPRDYQVEMFQAALKENIIVYLPTGSGKTFIAAMLIKELSSDVCKPLVDGGKRTVFLVPTVVLAVQQAEYLRRHTHLTVKEFFGSMGVDLWQKDKWKKEFEENHVLVMTAKIFEDILNHAFFSAHQVNLLIFDECHAAVKDAPMKQVMEKLSKLDVSRRPKILGLTAALFRKRCKINQVNDVILELAETMGCVVKIPNDVGTVYRNSTRPCETIVQYRDDGEGQLPDSLTLCKFISTSISNLLTQFEKRYGNSNLGEKSKILLNISKELLFLLNSFGPYGAYHAALVYKQMLEKANQIKDKIPEFGSDMMELRMLCMDIRNKCDAAFSKYPPRVSLELFVQPRITKLLEILRTFSPINNDSKVKLCGIIFVERRCMANVLYHFFKEVRQHDPSLEYLSPLFTMGQAATNANLKESNILNMKQKEIMRLFHEGSCNLLVATSVLEEGVDIPACNLIIRFDRIKTYCDYVQTKGRARSSKAFFGIMMSQSDTEAGMADLLLFHGIEQKLIATDEFDDDQDGQIEKLFAQWIQPYEPFGVDGARITALNSISLVHRYCQQLPCGTEVVLVPKWTLKKVREEEVDKTWLSKIRTLLKLLPSNTNYDLYECRLILPLNSSLREEVVGPVMPSQKLAKRSTAMEACIKLHELKEFDDAHLLPRSRLASLMEVDQLDTSGEMLDTSGEIPDTSGEIPDTSGEMPNTSGGMGEGEEVSQTKPATTDSVYDRWIPKCFKNCLPKPGQLSRIYSINFRLTKGTKEEKKSFSPSNTDIKLALVLSQHIPSISPFPLITRSGHFEVSIVGVCSVKLSQVEIDLLLQFHRYMFTDVVYLGKKTAMDFDAQYPRHQCLIVPLERDSTKIDFAFIQKMLDAPPIDWDERPSLDNYFAFNSSVYKDGIVFPWYRPFGTLNAYYVDVVVDLTASSSFPNRQFPTYAEYFSKKYKLNLTNKTQNLLEVSREWTGKNFLIPRTVKERLTEEEINTTYLVPELCYLHPIPSTVWKQIVWIPSILHRLTGLLLAEELRVQIHREAKIGVEFLPYSVNVSSVWSPLLLQTEQPNGSILPVADPRLLPTSFRPRMSPKNVDLLSADAELVWNVELLDSFSLSDSTDDDPLNLTMNSPDSSTIAVPDDETLNLRFDISSLSSVFGPSPGEILEALTLTGSSDGYDMERLETLGDSLLKLTISIYAFGLTYKENMNEGQLSLMRAQQISNENLFRLGHQKNLGNLMAGQCFDVANSFLPPCFRPNGTLHNGPIDQRLQQVVSSKHIADSVEALIGIYLLSCGIKGSITLMNWFGLETIPENRKEKKIVHDFNKSNGFPMFHLPMKVANLDAKNREMLGHLSTGLESFEKQLNYTFNDKTLLIEALTHPTYYSNRLTGCYERLEFLGDAVLDYLVTRYFYDSPNHYTPGILTDLRSAMVNNETFAVMAVRNNFHHYLKSMSAELSAILDRFVKFSEENRYLLTHDYFVLKERSGEQVAFNVLAPKVLGDIFESVAGAIFLDSGMSLDVVWKSYLPFLYDGIEKFEANIPISHLRMLHERFPSGVKFKKEPKLLPDDEICVSIELDGLGVFKGAGRNSKAAKTAVAKYALSEVKKQIKL